VSTRADLACGLRCDIIHGGGVENGVLLECLSGGGSVSVMFVLQSVLTIRQSVAPRAQDRGRVRVWRVRLYGWFG
jgi:hypothetical protein